MIIYDIKIIIKKVGNQLHIIRQIKISKKAKIKFIPDWNAAAINLE